VAVAASLVALAFTEQAQEQQPPKHFTNSIGMKFVWIPPGTFLMGSPKEEEKRDDNEIQHNVTLTKGFYLGVCTVTQEQWQAVMSDNPSRFKGEKKLPVENVTWGSVRNSCRKWLASTVMLIACPRRRNGNTLAVRDQRASSAAATIRSCYSGTPGAPTIRGGKPHPVGQKKPNAWGLHDMHGNIWEWCADRYGDYPKNDVVDPKGPESGTSRVLRGGSFHSPVLFVRSAVRGYFDPAKRSLNIGFRAART